MFILLSYKGIKTKQVINDATVPGAYLERPTANMERIKILNFLIIFNNRNNNF